MPSIIEARHVFPSAVVGTPPMEFAILLRQVGDTVDPPDVLTIQGTLSDAWDDHLGPLLWSGLGAGQLQLVITDSNGVVEVDSALTTPTGGTQSLAPGVSIRVVFVAPRPPKGRANACYLPLPTPGSVNQEGTVSSGAKEAVADWGDALLEDGALGGLSWVAKHQIGGPDATPTFAVVQSCSAAPTASYLRRRYR